MTLGHDATPPNATTRSRRSCRCRSGGSTIVPAIPYWVDLARGSRSDACRRDAGELAEARGPRACRPRMPGSRPSTRSTARRTSRTSSSTTAARRPGRQAALATSDARRGRRVHAAVDHVRGRVQGLAGPRQAASPTTLKDADVATQSFWPTIATFGMPYNLLVLAKVDDEASRRARGGVRRRLDDRGAGRASRQPGSCTRSTRASSRRSSRSRPRRRACASPRAPSRCSRRIRRPRRSRRSRSCSRRRRRPTTRLRQEGRGVALRAPGGEDLDHRVGHLAGTRLPLAHRHGRDADDHVQPASRRPPALGVAAAAVAVAHRLRLRPAHDPLFGQISPPTPVGGPMALAQAARPVRAEARLPRRRPAAPSSKARDRREGLHGEQ